MSESQYAKSTSSPRMPHSATRGSNGPARIPGGSVPVLFSLKNVQPQILHGNPGGIPLPSARSQSSAAATDPKDAIASAPTVAVQAGLPPSPSEKSQLKPRASSKPQRIQNLVAGSLVLVLVILVVRLSIPSKSPKTDSPEIASTAPVSDSTPGGISGPAAPSAPSDLKQNPRVDSTPNRVSAPSATQSTSPESIHQPPAPFLLAGPAPSSVGFGNKPEPRNEGILVGSNGGSLPTPPLTLQSHGDGDGFQYGTGANESAASGEQTNVARPEIGGTTASTEQPTLPMNIQNTQVPEQTMHDLFELYERSKQQSMRTVSGPGSFSSAPNTNGISPATPYVPVSAQRDLAPVTGRPGESLYQPVFGSNNAPSLPLSGQSYPPIEREYQPLKVPDYESMPAGSASGTAGANPNRYQPIRQPNPTIAPSTRPRTPYVPVMPSGGPASAPAPLSMPPAPTGSNSFGYPPGS